MPASKGPVYVQSVPLGMECPPGLQEYCGAFTDTVAASVVCPAALYLSLQN